MFKCEKCGRITEPREKLTKKPIITREKVYQQIIKKGYYGKINTTVGYEIVKEINLCEKCALEDKNGN